tara:strand:+ start:624 stop:785 length:162 start_codon:yes stop_codon:yes gene_type:complete
VRFFWWKSGAGNPISLRKGVAEFINSIKPFDKRHKKVSEFGTTMGTTDVSNRL